MQLASDPESIALHVSQVTTVNRPNGPLWDATFKAGVTSTHLSGHLPKTLSGLRYATIQLGTV